MTPYDWTDGGSVDVFLSGEYGFTSMRSRFYGMGVELKDKIT